MVIISEIRASNARITLQGHRGVVCVFAGATAGIGAATLRELVSMLQSATFYILGRDPSRYEDNLNELRDINPTNKIIFVETQVSVISDVDRVCKQIATAESKIDIICLSTGGMPFHGAVCTTPFPSPTPHI